LTARTGHGFFSFRIAASVFGLAAFAACLSLATSSFAQEAERPGLLNRLFGFKPAYRVENPPAAVAKPRPRAEPGQRKKKPRVHREGADAPPVAVVAKRPDARNVLVIGDFLGSGLAEGLTTALTQNPNVKVVDRTSGSSGFVREDFHNWPEKVDELITIERPAAVIVMIGTNDRQQMLVDGVREPVRSENWNAEYAERAAELARAIADRKVPFLWVGMPSFKSSKMMLDVLAFNDIYRAAAASAGGEFIDIWDGFVDENGAYVASGPDVNGQQARLRANDGINLARPGKRKVAFYVEKPLYKVLGEDPSAIAAAATATRAPYRLFGPFGPSEGQPDLDLPVDPNETGPIDPARPVALRTPALDGGLELLGAVAQPRHEARTPAERLAIEGIAPAPVPGRADQFAWSQVASAAAALRQINRDATVNKKMTPSMAPEPETDRAAPRPVRSDVLARPHPDAPLRNPPEVVPDRPEEISQPQPAPAMAAAPAPMTTPATFGKAGVPDFAKGDVLDTAPLRSAPKQSYKRPKSIGPEPNRAPTAVPKPVEELLPPAASQQEIPTASNADAPSEASTASASALPDAAPLRSPAPSILRDVADPVAPAREVPRRADPVPVAALPVAKVVPTEMASPPQAPKLAAPNEPVEPSAGISEVNAAPSAHDAMDSATREPPATLAPSVLSAPAAPALQAAPTALPAGTGETAPLAAPAPAGIQPAAAAPSRAGTPTAPSSLGDTAGPAAPPAPLSPAASELTSPGTPARPVPPATIPEPTAVERAGSPLNPGDAAPQLEKAPVRTESPPGPAEAPATPPAPAAPTILPENAAVSPAPAAPTKPAASAVAPAPAPAGAQPSAGDPQSDPGWPA